MNLVKENKAIVPLQIEKEFETLFTKNFSSEPQWSKERRNECFKYFLQTGIPNRKNEEYKYTDTRKLFSDKITTSPNESYKLTSTLTPLNKNAIQIIFVNGMLHAPIGKHTLPKGVIIGSLAEHPDIRKKYLNRSTDTFVNLNAALWTDGALVFIPENVQLEQNIEIINIIKDSKEVLISPRHLIVAEKNSAVNIIERNLVEQSNNSIVNSVTDAILEENSKLRFYKVQYDCKNVALISATHVIQSKNSFFDTNTITLDSEWVRNNLTIELNGTNCESHLNGLYITDGNNHIDNHTSVLHNEPNCQSNQLYKGVLDGKSTGIFNGKIFVKRDAQKTNAYQSSKNILLSDDATINTKPQLEIYADDVKCSHGSSTGRLDKDAVFYLRTRGLGEERAKRLLLYAFVNDVLNTIKDESLKAHLEELVNAQLEK